ncbi:MAG: hypothetical protein KDB80_17595 [Planctomycetes bacterium]|nr:hypothetical protein [Planctomycetota bacterium]
MTASRNPFSERVGAILLAGCGLSMLAGFLGAVFWGDSPNVTNNASTSYSTSALGHAAFVELLERTGFPVVRSRFRSAERAWSGLLVVLEPTDDDRFDELVSDPELPSALIVLPKWEVVRDHPLDDRWIAEAGLRPTMEVESVARTIDASCSVVRIDGSGSNWSSDGVGESIPPSVSDLQLLTGGVDPWIDCDEGVLLGEVREGLWILSDPDVLTNHGIARGDNASLVLSIFEELTSWASIVIDETVHGFEFVPSVWTELRRFPFVLVMLHVMGLVVAALWCGLYRFGPPVPTASGVAAGKSVLIDNAAQLLLFGGHSGHLVRRYWSQARRRVREAYHLPREIADDELADTFRRIGRERTDYDAVERRVARATADRGIDGSELLAAARAVSAWREEMLDGSR